MKPVFWKVLASFPSPPVAETTRGVITYAIGTRPYFNRPGFEARRGAAQAISL